MAVKISNRDKAHVIDAAVRAYFRTYAQQVFDGKVTINEIVCSVHLELLKVGARMNEATKGDVYDTISLLGPDGEGDQKWLSLYQAKQSKEVAA
jgi:hypothetical protein